MKGGVLQQLGTPYEVYNRPANTFVASFMGSPRMNLLRAKVVADGGAIRLDIGGARCGWRCRRCPLAWTVMWGRK